MFQPSDIEHLPIEVLIPYANNARTHSDAQIAQVAASMREFGWTNPVLIDGEDGIIAGHGRVLAARVLGIESIPCIRLPHLTEVQRRAYLIADNKLAQNAGWDDELLRIELERLKEEDFDVGLTGMSEREIDALMAGDEDWEGVNDSTGGNDDDDGDEDKGDGSLLGLINVAVGEPEHQVHHGEVWQMGPHVLLIASVVSEWDAWSPYLDHPENLFCPYPGPFTALGEKADDHKLVLVQPNRYVAGHILDEYVAVKGAESVRRVHAP